MTANSARTAYKNLKSRFADISHLGGIGSFLNKEGEVTMPKGSAAERDAQQMALRGQIHFLMADPLTEKWLKQAERDVKFFSKNDRRNLQLMRQAWIHEASLPEHLSRELARLDSEGGRLHAKTHKSGNWNKMKGWYAHSFKTLQAVGTAKKDLLGVPSVYDALLDQFSPGLRNATVEKEFALLEKELAPMIKEAVARQKKEKSPLKLPAIPFEQQQELCLRVTKAMGYDYNRGRFDVTKDTHPSSGGTSDYTWITSRFHENDFLDTLFAAIHEAGHGMYDQNQPEKWRFQPAGQHLGMAVHESESMIWELQACKTPEFFRYLEREARAIFNLPKHPALKAENLQKLVTRVKPSFIRIEADEMTYPAHVVLRWRLEKAMIEGKLKPADLPKAWNKGIKDLLGITPSNNAKGCMQDVHWPAGLVGYFPAYTLGAMGAAQLFATASREKPSLSKQIEKGNFRPFKELLRDNVHGKGALVTPDELFKQATGETLNARAYLNHLSERYLGKPWAPQQVPRPQPGPAPDGP